MYATDRRGIVQLMRVQVAKAAFLALGLWRFRRADILLWAGLTPAGMVIGRAMVLPLVLGL
jgi:hypothetical protein